MARRRSAADHCLYGAAEEVLQTGVCAFVLKSKAATEIVQAIAALNGRQVVRPR